MKNLTFALFVLLIPVTPLFAQHSAVSPEKARKLIQRFAGSWSCQGAFTSNKKSLEADLTFSPALNGKAMEYRHRDRLPHKFQALGLWSVDAASGRPVYTSVFASHGNPATSSNFFAGRLENDSTLVFTADTLLAPPFKPNRFIYEMLDEAHFEMTWQVLKKGSWTTGDYLNCRAAQQKTAPQKG